MDAFAEENDEPVTQEFFELRDQVTRRDYAEIFSAIPGLNGRFVTQDRKDRLYRKIEQVLWPALSEFYQLLENWQDAWMKGVSNPALLYGAILSQSGGGTMPGLPPMQAPDTSGLRVQAAAVADAVNNVFSGTGAQIASALASEAVQIRQVLGNPRLPALVGTANREQMLKKLGVAVSPAYAIQEEVLAKFVLSVLDAQNQPPDVEVRYYGALFMLTSQVSLTGTGIGSTSSGRRFTPIGGEPAKVIGRTAISSHIEEDRHPSDRYRG